MNMKATLTKETTSVKPNERGPPGRKMEKKKKKGGGRPSTVK